jgi:YVTN family beta-propeller protein
LPKVEFKSENPVNRRSWMTSEKSLIRRVALLGALALVTLAGIPRLEAAQTPSPALLIAVEGDHALTIADPVTMKVVATVPTGDMALQVAVSDDGKLAFVTTSKTMGKGNNPDAHLADEGVLAPNDDYISVIDLAAQKELHRVKTGLGSRPHGIVFAGGKVYFTAGGYQLIGRYDPASNRIDWMMGTAQGHTHLLVITKDLKKIFAVNTASNSVTAITPWDDPTVYAPPLWKVTTIPVGKAPQGFDMSPDEKEVWAATKGDGGVSIIDVATKKVTQTLKLSVRVPVRLKFTPDGKRVLIADEFDGTVVALDAATRKEIKRITVVKQTEEFEIVNDNTAVQNGVAIMPKSVLRELLMAPDGSCAYVGVMGSNRIDILDLKTLEVTGSISTGAVPKGMAWAERNLSIRR